MNPVGQHVMLDFFDCQCSPEILSDLAKGQAIFEELKSQFTCLDATHNQFSPAGYSIILLLAESHASIHTWPESKFAALDLFTCVGRIPYEAVHLLIKAFQPERHAEIVCARGVRPQMPGITNQRPETVAHTINYDHLEVPVPEYADGLARTI